MLLAYAGLAGCVTIPEFGDENSIERGKVGFVQGFYGGVAADEPHAVLVGRDVLAAGGSAADAAVAMYFMLSVTYPSAASLGGGGLCLTRESKTGKVETLDFLGQTSSGVGGNQVNVPANPRGFFALHAKYGSLEWREVIRPAENAARFGVQVSRAFAREILSAGPLFVETSGGRFMAQQNGGRPHTEGDTMTQPELGAVLATLRSRGAGAMYAGPYARQIVSAAQESGAALTYGDLQAVRPLWRSALEVLFDTRTSFYLPLPRTPAGTMAAKALAATIGNRRFQNADDGMRAHLLAETIQRALVDGARGFETVSPKANEPRVRLPGTYIDDLMENFLEDRVVQLAVRSSLPSVGAGGNGQTSFVSVDRFGGVVACFITMNNRFGVKRVIRGTGIIMASPPSSTVARDMSAGLLLMSGRDKNLLYMVGSSSGGIVGQAAVMQAALRAGGGTPDDMDVAIRSKRLFRDPGRAVTYVEDGTPLSVLNALRRRGHQLQSLPTMGRVNLIFCAKGLPSNEATCGVRSDPRGFGLGSSSAS